MSERTKFTAWITKDALTRGIEKIEVEDRFAISERMVKAILIGDEFGASQCFHKPDWHRDPEYAIGRAEEMRDAKIASLKKKIAKLEKMTFDDTPE